MYIPPAFVETDITALHNFIEANSFGLLVSTTPDGPFASHIPFLLDRNDGPHGALVAHVARANPQWRHFTAGVRGLAVFSGPHAYISPAWYEAEPVVPTWNYSAVHAIGPVETIEDRGALLELVDRFVRHFEANRDQPWVFDTSTEFAKRLADQIVGLRMPVERLEGKWKVGQNQPEARRLKAAAALEELGDEPSREVARMMRGTDLEGDRGRREPGRRD
jgi:transcriptional regulator